MALGLSRRSGAPRLLKKVKDKSWARSEDHEETVKGVPCKTQTSSNLRSLSDFDINASPKSLSDSEAENRRQAEISKLDVPVELSIRASPVCLKRPPTLQPDYDADIPPSNFRGSRTLSPSPLDDMFDNKPRKKQMYALKKSNHAHSYHRQAPAKARKLGKVSLRAYMSMMSNLLEIVQLLIPGN